MGLLLIATKSRGGFSCFLWIIAVSNNLVSQLGLACLWGWVFVWFLSSEWNGVGDMAFVWVQDAHGPPAFNLLRLAEGAEGRLARAV